MERPYQGRVIGMNDRELLAQFVADRSPEAFAELVRRNTDMVYSSARRQLGDAALAEDVAQAAFLLLSQKSASVKGSVPAWLMTVTLFACRDARKRARRRIIHERRAAQMRPESGSASGAWEEYAPMLDQEIARLRRKDREAIVLRFFRQMSFAEVGHAMGVSEEAARNYPSMGDNRRNWPSNSPPRQPWRLRWDWRRNWLHRRHPSREASSWKSRMGRQKQCGG
jgi:RNA polymerase sigma factor (sigma-70 family)